MIVYSLDQIGALHQRSLQMSSNSMRDRARFTWAVGSPTPLGVHFLTTYVEAMPSGAFFLASLQASLQAL